MVDTWIMVQDIELNVARLRSLCVMKSRGMPHSNEVRRFIISKKGILLTPLEGNSSEFERSAKELMNLSTSKASNDFKESAREK